MDELYYGFKSSSKATSGHTNQGHTKMFTTECMFKFTILFSCLSNSYLTN